MLVEVAEKSGLGRSFVSEIERDQVSLHRSAAQAVPGAGPRLKHMLATWTELAPDASAGSSSTRFRPGRQPVMMVSVPPPL